jgi:AP-3 complex subunit beta
LKKLLDSRRESDILEGLRRVVTIFYTQSASATQQYFTAVVKNVASTNPEIKRLVYALLIQLAEATPDTALLSVNTIQRGLSDPNAQSRALALRTMSSIRVPVISQIVALGIKRGTVDMSPLVRRTAAFAIPKCYRLDPNTKPLLEEQIATLLGDKQYFVVGAAVVAFADVCPERIDLVHPNFRSLVKKLVDMDEWGQLATLELMLSYSRKCFSKRQKKASTAQEPLSDEKKSEVDIEQAVALDPDLEFLLDSAKPLLQSRNSAVIVAVSRLFLYLGTHLHMSQTAGPLISTLRSSPDVKTQTINTILSICQLNPQPFVPHTTKFLLSSSDSPTIISTKLTIQSLLFPHVSPILRSLLLTDLEHHTRSSDPTILRAAVVAIGRCATSAPTPALRTRCLQLLLKQLSSPDATLVGASLDEIRGLIQRSPEAHAKTIVRLARHLDALTAPRARAAIVWLVGEFAAAEGSTKIAADVWRILLKDFATETEVVQAQILLLAAKVYLHCSRQKEKELAKIRDDTEGGDERTGSTERPINKDFQKITQMLNHTWLLARYAQSYALRDRARYLMALVINSPNTDLGALLLLADKPLSSSGLSSDSLTDAPEKEQFAIGTASQILGIPLRGAETVPPWTTVERGSAERKGTVSASVSEVGSPGVSRMLSITKAEAMVPKRANGVATKTLDEWLDEEDEEEDESSEEEEESSEEESEEESSEEEDSVEENTQFIQKS